MELLVQVSPPPSDDQEDDQEIDEIEDAGNGRFKPWPYVVNIDSTIFSKSVLSRLNSTTTTTLNRTDISGILTALYDYATQYTFYPTPDRLRHLSAKLIEKWPQLLEGLDHDDAIDKWIVRLNDKFKNARRKESNVIVMTKKRKKITTNDHSEKRFMWGVPGYCPPREDGEDDCSIAVYRRTVCEQGRLSKRSRNLIKCNTAMRKLFPERRAEITSGELMKMDLIKEAYPLLFDEDALFLEFKLITGIDAEGMFISNLANYLSKLLKLPVLKKESSSIKILRNIEKPDEACCEKLALHILAFNLKAVGVVENHVGTPHVLCNSDDLYEVMILWRTSKKRFVYCSPYFGYSILPIQKRSAHF